MWSSALMLKSCSATIRRNVTKKKKPPIYRVMLHNDSFNRREYVVSVLLKVVDGLAMDDAVNVMQVRTASLALTCI